MRNDKTPFDPYSRAVSNADKLFIASIVAGLLSVILSMMILSIAAVVMAIIGASEMSSAAREASLRGIALNDPKLSSLRKKRAIALVVAIASVVINVIVIIVLLPQVLEMMGYSDFASLYADVYSDAYDYGSLAGPETNSTWG